MNKLLSEGGNVWGDVTPFSHDHIPYITKTIASALAGTGIKIIPVGSGATPTPGKMSGDLDVIADEEAVLDYFNVNDAKSGRKALSAYIAAKGLKTAQTGINVHVRVPMGDDMAHQVDIMIVPNAKKIAKFHTHNIPAGSPYKGVNKQLIIAALAKSKGYVWSAWQGLFARDANGKKAALVTTDLNKIAALLLGNGNTAENLGSTESILAALPPDVSSTLLTSVKKDPHWPVTKVKESTGNWFRDLMNKIQ